MSTSTLFMQSLMKKIGSLPEECIAEIEDFVDFLKERAQAQQPAPGRRAPIDFPVISVEQWPEDLSLHREDMYGDDGR